MIADTIVLLTLANTRQVRGSRGTANFVYKCALCEREHQVSIVAGSVKTVTESDADVEIVQFEVRLWAGARVANVSGGRTAAKNRSIVVVGGWGC